MANGKKGGEEPRQRLLLEDGSGVVYLVTYKNPVTSTREVDPTVYEDADTAVSACIDILNEGLSSGEDPEPAMIQVVIDPVATLAVLTRKAE